MTTTSEPVFQPRLRYIGQLLVAAVKGSLVAMREGSHFG